MKILLKTCLLLIIPGLIVSCKDDDKENTPTPGTPAPAFTYIKNGNASTFKGTAESLGGLSTDDAFRLRIVSDLGSGKFKAVLEQLKDFSSFPPSTLTTPIVLDTIYWIKGDTELADYDASYSSGSKFTFIKKDPAVNEVYSSPQDTTRRKVIDIKKSITVPAGTFECVMIRQYNNPKDEDSVTYYLHKDSGLIKLEQHLDGITLDLQSKNF